MNHELVKTLEVIVLNTVWFSGAYYCWRTAKKLKINSLIAIYVGIFLPLLSIIIYYYFSFRNKDKKQKIKTLKILTSTVAILILAFGGLYYYILGTPEYSLYKLKKAIIANDNIEIERYFDIDKTAKKLGKSSAQLQEEIRSINTSILEIMEENPDKAKDTDVYTPTGINGGYLESAYAIFPNGGVGNSQIILKFDFEGTKLLAEVTRRNINKRIAIYLRGRLIMEPIIGSEITTGEVVIEGKKYKDAGLIADTINKERISMINGFKIRNRRADGENSKITIERIINSNSGKYETSALELNMIKIKGRYWRVDYVNNEFDGIADSLPEKNGKKAVTFEWKYKGKNYSIEKHLYESYYNYYKSLASENIFNGESLITQLENYNEMFISGVDGDNTIKELVESLRQIGENNNLNEDQIVDLAAVFVQTIPYDTDEFNNIKSSIVNKVDYPYEVLYKNRGICSDKSYLAYSILEEMGYGVAFFLFPEDQHIAVGIECPREYSNYDSGYCFFETTTLGNKIGSTPNISKEFGLATAKVQLSDYSKDDTENQTNPLGKIEILSKKSGKTYEGIIETVKIQKELDSMLAAIKRMDTELDVMSKNIDDKKDDIDDTEAKLKKLEGNLTIENYNEYKSYYDKYKKKYLIISEHVEDYNKRVTSRNQLNTRFNNLSDIFYQ